MIEYLQIENVALIENIQVDFGNGLNILSGETGTGKSIIIDSINFILGQRPSKDFIRNGAEMAVVQGTISIKNQEVVNIIKDMGVHIEDDNTILLYRSFTTGGKNICKINGKTVTVSMIKDISSILVDVHGQHNHQSLLDSKKHIELLDRFCGEELNILKEELSINLKNYKETAKKIKELTGNTMDREGKIQLLEFSIEEIGNLKLVDGEEERLKERMNVLNNSKKLTVNALKTIELLYYGEDNEGSAIENISESLKMIREITDIDNTNANLYETLESINIQLGDFIRDFRVYSDSLDHDPEELNKIENRLDKIYSLKRKYGQTIPEILAYYDNAVNQLDMIVNSEGKVNKLIETKKKIANEVTKICENISKIRKKTALIIENSIIDILVDLGMKNVQFKIDISRKKEYSLTGFDIVEFMISTNAGEPIKPLAKIASGGEMSRIMLAIKSVLASEDNIETFIFDEIDTGVSGRTAQKVAEKLNSLCKNFQILCITHLPQIASMADFHYLIEKKTIENKTTTNVYKLDKNAITHELARLIGGAKITDATLSAAKEMREMALNLK